MKCKHGNEANSICVSCGAALCDEFSELTSSGKHVCSSECAEDITRKEFSADLALTRNTDTTKAAAYGSYLLGVILIGFGLYTFATRGMSWFPVFMFSAGLGLAAMGVLVQKSVKPSAFGTKE
jgi:hypothetical protein